MTDTIVNNVLTSATISLGQTIFDVVDFAGDQDWFRITLQAGTYDFRLDNGGIGDPYLYLYDESGSLLIQNDDSFGTQNSFIRFSVATAGTFYLGAGGYGTRSGGYYLSAVPFFADQPPDAVDDSLSDSPENTVRMISTGALLSNDSGGPGTRAVTDVFDASGGTVALLNGIVAFVPAANYRGLASFSYTIVNDQGLSDTARASFTITPVNDAPTARADTIASSAEDATRTISTAALIMNDSDSNGDALTVTSVSATAQTHGSVSLAHDGTITYVPARDYNGPVSFSYTISDGQGGTDTAEVSFTVTPLDDAPNANADVAFTPENAPILIDVLVNDISHGAGDGNSIVEVGFDGVPQGKVTLVDNKIVYDPGNAFDHLAIGQSAQVSLHYWMQDGAGARDDAIVTVTITGTNDAPVARGDTASVIEDQSVTGNLLSNDSDTDLGDVLSVSQVNGQAANVGTAIAGQWGTLLLSADGSYSYAADGDALGLATSAKVDSFTYQVSDGHGGTATATLNVNIALANDNDSQSGGNHADRLNGDRRSAGAEDTIRGGNGNDVIDGKAGADRLFGENGDDTLYGGSGRDFLDGGNGNDRLECGDGNDTLFGGRGDDVLIGGAGADTFVFLPGHVTATGNDRIADFEVGVDQLSLQGGVGVGSLQQVGGDTLLTLSSGGTITLQGVTSADWSALHASIDFTSQVLVA